MVCPLVRGGPSAPDEIEVPGGRRDRRVTRAMYPASRSEPARAQGPEPVAALRGGWRSAPGELRSDRLGQRGERLGQPSGDDPGVGDEHGGGEEADVDVAVVAHDGEVHAGA